MINGVVGRTTHVEGSRARVWRATAPRSQRQRLLGAFTHLVVNEGYGDVTISRIVAAAGVSRPTFYEFFRDREACFAAALEPIAEQLLTAVREAVERELPHDALDAATRSLLAYARSQPSHARLLMSEALIGGSEPRDMRDRVIDEAALIVERAHEGLPADAVVSGLPAGLILGAVCRMLASRLCSVKQRLSELEEGLPNWLAAYAQPAARDYWRALAALAPPARSPFVPVALCAPRQPQPGRPRANEGAADESNWLRIVFAAAEVVRRDGSAAATVAKIAAAAGVDSRAFYRLFASKQRALVAAAELLFTHAIAAAAGAFVAGETWPERVWEAARALTQYAEENPTLTYVALVESYGSEASQGQRVHELAQAFTVFLQEGHAPTARASDAPSELALESIAMAAFELCYRHVRDAGDTQLSSLLGGIVFISLAPFLGAQQAGEFVSGRQPDREGPSLLSVA